jgi:hypothetical protein
MKIFILAILALVFLSAAQGQDENTILDNSSNFRLFTARDILIDLKFIDPDKGTFGIDYKINLERSIGTLFNSSYRNLKLNFNSAGFITVAGEKNQNNSIISSLDVSAFPLFRVQPKSITPTHSWEDLIDIDTTLSVDEDPLINLSRNLAEEVSSPFWLFWNLHAKHETTQDFKNYDFAFGTQVSFSTSYLSAILDFPFGLLRTSRNNNPRQLDLSVGYDYVVGINNTLLEDVKDNSDYMNRLNFKAEWETGILTRNDRIIFLFDSYLDINPSEAQKQANKDWNTFYMIKLEHSLGRIGMSRTRAKIAIKYTQGKLPPNFETGYILGGGFSIDF